MNQHAYKKTCIYNTVLEIPFAPGQETILDAIQKFFTEHFAAYGIEPLRYAVSGINAQTITVEATLMNKQYCTYLRLP